MGKYLFLVGSSTGETLEASVRRDLAAIVRGRPRPAPFARRSWPVMPTSAGTSGSSWPRRPARPGAGRLRPLFPGPGHRRRGEEGGASCLIDRPRISALIVAKDEAENLPGCLESLAWADETVVVVDAASRDRTEAIARTLAIAVLVRPFDDFAGQRNAALGLATGDWVFAVDADERATPDLGGRDPPDPGRPLARPTPATGCRSGASSSAGRSGYSGTQHDRPLRLFRRDLGRWVGTVHETVDLQGTAGQMLGHLTHRTIPDMQTFLRKIDHYTTLEAIQLHREGQAFRSIDLTLRPLWTFAKLYLGKQGFRDGLEGLAFCALSGLSVAVRHWKLRELIQSEARAIVDDPGAHDAGVRRRPVRRGGGSIQGGGRRR